MKRRVFVSALNNQHLDDRRRTFKAAILKKISDSSFDPQEFWESGIPEALSWSFENTEKVMRRCVGAVVLGFHDGPFLGIDDLLSRKFLAIPSAHSLRRGPPKPASYLDEARATFSVPPHGGSGFPGCGNGGRRRACAL